MRKLVTTFMVGLLLILQAALAQDLITETESIASSLASAVVSAGYQSVAIIDPLDANDNPSAFGRFIAEELSGAMVNAGQLRVIDRLSLQRILDEQRLSLSGLVNDADAVQRIGDLAGVEVLIVGTYFVLGPNVRLSLKGLNVQTAQNVAAVNTTVLIDDSVASLLSINPSAMVRGSASDRTDATASTMAGADVGRYSTNVEYDPNTDTYYIYNLCKTDAWIEIESAVSYSDISFVLTPNSAMNAKVVISVGDREVVEVFHNDWYAGKSRPTEVSVFVGPSSADKILRLEVTKYQERSYSEMFCAGTLALGEMVIR